MEGVLNLSAFKNHSPAEHEIESQFACWIEPLSVYPYSVDACMIAVNIDAFPIDSKKPISEEYQSNYEQKQKKLFHKYPLPI